MPERDPRNISRQELEGYYAAHAGAPVTAHKAWYGAALAAISTIAGLIVGAMQVIDISDVVAASGMPLERVTAWWKIGLALLTVIAGCAVTGGTVFAVRNKPRA